MSHVPPCAALWPALLGAVEMGTVSLSTSVSEKSQPGEMVKRAPRTAETQVRTAENRKCAFHLLTCE